MGERRLLLSWAKAGKDSKGRNKATRSEGDDLGDSAARALMRHGAPQMRTRERERERERRLLLSWAKAGKDSKEMRTREIFGVLLLLPG